MYRKVFKTLRGRTVRDGGGVESDINSPERRPSSLEIALLLQVQYVIDTCVYVRTLCYTKFVHTAVVMCLSQ
jgi:hypothetical protein